MKDYCFSYIRDTVTLCLFDMDLRTSQFGLNQNRQLVSFETLLDRFICSRKVFLYRIWVLLAVKEEKEPEKFKKWFYLSSKILFLLTCGSAKMLPWAFKTMLSTIFQRPSDRTLGSVFQHCVFAGPLMISCVFCTAITASPLSMACHWTPAFTKGTVAMGSTPPCPPAPNPDKHSGVELINKQRLRYAITRGVSPSATLAASHRSPLPVQQYLQILGRQQNNTRHLFLKVFLGSWENYLGCILSSYTPWLTLSLLGLMN